MANESKTVSSLPALAAANSTTKLVVSQTYANGTIATDTLPIANAFAFIPGPYANDAVANSNGVGVKSLYYNASGQVLIRLT